jgi:hypothetical protein
MRNDESVSCEDSTRGNISYEPNGEAEVDVLPLRACDADSEEEAQDVRVEGRARMR